MLTGCHMQSTNLEMKTKKVKRKRQKTVSYRNVSTIAMVAGKEKTISKIIHDGHLMEWVAIGWIDLGKATASDKKNYPTVK